MNKTKALLLELTQELNKVNTNALKATIGDSTNNNRTITVGQAIRFFNTGRRTHTGLGTKLEAAYNSNSVRMLLRALRKTTKRTDAVDVTELVKALTVAAIIPKFSRPLGRVL